MKNKILLSILIVSTVITIFGCAKSPYLSTNPYMNTNLTLAMIYLERNQISRSQQLIKNTISEFPNNPIAWDMLARSFEKSGDINQADHYYRYAVKLNPHSGEAHNNYGVFLCQQGYYLSAMREFKTALSQKNYDKKNLVKQNQSACAKIGR